MGPGRIGWRKAGIANDERLVTARRARRALSCAASGCQRCRGASALAFWLSTAPPRLAAASLGWPNSAATVSPWRVCCCSQAALLALCKLPRVPPGDNADRRHRQTAAAAACAALPEPSHRDKPHGCDCAVGGTRLAGLAAGRLRLGHHAGGHGGAAGRECLARRPALLNARPAAQLPARQRTLPPPLPASAADLRVQRRDPAGRGGHRGLPSETGSEAGSSAGPAATTRRSCPAVLCELLACPAHPHPCRLQAPVSCDRFYSYA